MEDEASRILGIIFATNVCIYIWDNKIKEYKSYIKLNNTFNGTVRKSNCERSIESGDWKVDPEERVFIWD